MASLRRLHVTCREYARAADGAFATSAALSYAAAIAVRTPAILMIGFFAMGCRAPAPQPSRYMVHVYGMQGDGPDQRRRESPAASIPISPVCSDGPLLNQADLVWRERSRPGRWCEVAKLRWPDLPDGSYLLSVANLGIETDSIAFRVEAGKRVFH
jgi:hypothetical protein